MIESRHWRNALAADLEILKKLRIYSKWSEQKQVLFERQATIIAFQIRCLLERPIVSPNIANAKIELVYFYATDSSALTKAMGGIDSIYDWETSEIMNMNAMNFLQSVSSSAVYVCIGE